MSAWAPASAAADWVWWPAREPVTYRTQTAPGVYADTAPALTHPVTGSPTADVAKRLKLTFKELAASGGAYVSQDRTWLIPTAALTAVGVTPKVGDQVEDAGGTRWTVLTVDSRKFGLTTALTTRDLVLVYALRDTLTQGRSAAGPDAAGGRTPRYATVAADVPAKVQEVAAAAGDRLGQRQAPRVYEITVGQRLALRALDRLTDQAGTVYQVTGWRQADRIDVLMVVDAERVS